MADNRGCRNSAPNGAGKSPSPLPVRKKNQVKPATSDSFALFKETLEGILPRNPLCSA